MNTDQQLHRNSVTPFKVLVLRRVHGLDHVTLVDAHRVDPYDGGQVHWTAQVPNGDGEALARQWFPDALIEVVHTNGRRERVD